ncbi:hypothetical protein ACFFNY_31080 [Paenibacillus hodogayensis]|uniref:Uncharacterized protein n=1 Tax=Paenibacillus hodogayensis TaxID=279208 RepID=A0ABV5W642_9BACL
MLKEDAYCICKLYMNRPVRLQTKSGHIYDGHIVHVDAEHVYLQPQGGTGATTRGFFPYPGAGFGPGPGFYGGGAGAVQTLALFDLLAITLLLL